MEMAAEGYWASSSQSLTEGLKLISCSTFTIVPLYSVYSGQLLCMVTVVESVSFSAISSYRGVYNGPPVSRIVLFPEV